MRTIFDASRIWVIAPVPGNTLRDKFKHPLMARRRGFKNNKFNLVFRSLVSAAPLAQFEIYSLKFLRLRKLVEAVILRILRYGRITKW